MIEKSQSPIQAIHNSHLSYQLAKLCEQDNNAPFCIVVQNNSQVTQLHEELRLFLPVSAHQRILALPDWETLPYDSVNAHRHIATIRIRTLYQLTQRKNPIVICSLPAFSQRVIPREFVIDQCFICRVGETMTVNTFRSLMLEKGYDEVPEVSDTGQFAIRGAILDVILSEHSALGFRIELFDDEIDSIRRLDVTTNRSDTTLPSVEILPSREYLNKQPSHDNIEKVLCHCPPHLQSVLAKLLRQPSLINGVEYYLPFLHSSLDHIEDYLAKNTQFIIPKELDTQWPQEWQSIERAFTKQLNQNRPVASPASLYIDPIKFLSTQHTQTYSVHPIESKDNSAAKLPELVSHPKLKHPYQSLTDFVNTQPHITLFAHNRSRSENLQQALQSDGIKAKLIEATDNIDSDCSLQIQTGPLRQGFICTETSIAFVSENDLIGRIINPHERVSKPRIDQAIEDWEVGTIIVHRDYGIGRFLEFRSIERDNTTSDFLVLEFADGDKLFVATQQFHLLSRYIGPKVKSVILTKLGGKRWQIKKKKAIENADIFAKSLLDQHALRQAQTAPKISISSADLAQFCEYFPYTETEDQLKSISAILVDINKKKAMNRLLCGDVGFGKTEVAMRAAFATVLSGYQVALLAPTTVLAQQHLNTFSDRFGHFPIRVATLSRLMTKQQQTLIKKELAEGKIDIIIATHSLLGKEISFANLGLLIIDEEHKFGVKQKEMIQAIGARSHVLAMSATPIPRSLHMSLAKLRDMSIIATPPKNRQSITTFVDVYNETMVQEALTRETQRGGQCYVIHNDIRSLEIIKETLQRLLPQAQCRVMHAKQSKVILEQTMIDFQKGSFDILLATTIIESGIDIANANTILLLRADLLGLSQIHQLRGRVGRSHHQAYAYLFTPPVNQMTSEGRARIATIKKQKQLGAGLNIAIEDMEIRGAGDLLGKKQSGNAEEVGLTLYSDMLKNAAKRLAGETHMVEDTQIDVDLGLDMHIPKQYIRDFAKRLYYYRAISRCDDQDKLHAMQASMEDQFGLLPKPVANLLIHREVQIRAARFGVNRIIDKSDYSECQMQNPEALRKLATTSKLNHLDIRIIGTAIRVMKGGKKVDWQKIFT
ncbi:MAG: transcription-repair coupling factor [Legionellales bacterium]|nr:transcription-repair coupling factor [Legionellales bacterium]